LRVTPLASFSMITFITLSGPPRPCVLRSPQDCGPAGPHGPAVGPAGPPGAARRAGALHGRRSCHRAGLVAPEHGAERVGVGAGDPFERAVDGVVPRLGGLLPPADGEAGETPRLRAAASGAQAELSAVLCPASAQVVLKSSPVLLGPMLLLIKSEARTLNSERKVSKSAAPSHVHSSHAAHKAAGAAGCINTTNPHRAGPCGLSCALPSCPPGE
jgi:hypothetical protein